MSGGTSRRQAAQTVGRLKNSRSGAQRLQGWRETCAAQGLGGEFAVAAKTGEPAYTEEQARMVAELFGR